LPHCTWKKKPVFILTVFETFFTCTANILSKYIEKFLWVPPSGMVLPLCGSIFSMLPASIDELWGLSQGSENGMTEEKGRENQTSF
jgi:hypothetical protein